MSTIPLDYETLRLIWWALLGILLIGFAIMGGMDLGIGALLPFVARTDEERRVAAQPLGPDLGRQPGLAGAGRRRDLCRLAGDLCRELLRLLPRHDRHPAGPDPAARRLQVPRQGRRSALARGVGLGAVRRRLRAVAGVRRRRRQPVPRRAVPARRHAARQPTRATSSCC